MRGQEGECREFCANPFTAPGREFCGMGSLVRGALSGCLRGPEVLNKTRLPVFRQGALRWLTFAAFYMK